MTDKKWRKGLTLLILCAAFVFHASAVYAQDNENDFTIVDGVLEKYSGTDSEVVIPEGVTTIGEKAFERNKTITKVTLPSTLTTIEDNAFYLCTNLVIPDFPANVTTIGNQAFASCYANTEEVIINNVSYIDSWAFHLCGSKKFIIDGNNTTIAHRAFSSGFIGTNDCSDLDFLKEAVLNGTFTHIKGAFDGRGKLEKVTINGTIEKLTDGFYGCRSLQTLIVNGDISEITSTILNADGTEGVFGSSSDLTIYGREGSNIQAYARKYEIPFVVIEADETTEPKNEVCLTEDNTSITKTEMQSLVDRNQSDDVTIRTNEGVVFMFPKGTMKMVGKDEFDFGIEMITEYDGANLKSAAKDGFVFRINYNYSGELPGTAQVSIPVDTKWNGRELYYYQIDDSGNLIDQNISAVVENGVYTIPVGHCSDYIALSKKLDSGNDTSSKDSGNKGQPTDSANKTSASNGGKDPSTGGEKNPTTGESNTNQTTDGPNKNPVANLSKNESAVMNDQVSGTDTRTQAVFNPASMSGNTDTVQTANMNNAADASADSTSPQTGDQTPLSLYVVLAFIAAGIILKETKHKIGLK